MTKLYRSQRDKKVSGLCGGLSDMLGVDSTLVRLVVIVTFFFSGGLMIPIYFIVAMMIPKEPMMVVPQMSGWNGYGGMAPGESMSQGMAGYSQDYNGYNERQSHNFSSTSNPTTQAAPSAEASHLDGMMQDIEKKAMWKEIQELKTKLSNYEKGEV